MRHQTRSLLFALLMGLPLAGGSTFAQQSGLTAVVTDTQERQFTLTNFSRRGYAHLNGRVRDVPVRLPFTEITTVTFAADEPEGGEDEGAAEAPEGFRTAQVAFANGNEYQVQIRTSGTEAVGGFEQTLGVSISVPLSDVATIEIQR